MDGSTGPGSGKRLGEARNAAMIAARKNKLTKDLESPGARRRKVIDGAPMLGLEQLDHANGARA